MQLISGTASSTSPFPTRKGAWRLRPGDVPSWVELPVDNRTIEAWRSRSAECGLGADAWVSLLVEHELVRSHLSQSGVEIRILAEEARRSLEVARLAPTPGLRQWAGQIAGHSKQASAPDELPAIVLTERLLAQIAPSPVFDFITAAVADEAEGDAVVMERAGAAAGLTMEAWAYLTALRLTAADAA
jgi:hypothetical protein